MKNKILISFLVSCFGLSAFAQVTINEFSASNLNTIFDSNIKTEDWIELYNSSNSTVDISGWHLSDKESKPMKWVIPNGTTISGQGYLLFYCSGRDLVSNNEYHTNFKLTQTSGTDIVLLSDASGTVLEQHDMGLTLVDNSHARSENGSNTWMICTEPTPGQSNNGSDQLVRYTVAPSMNLTAGFYEGAQEVTITNNEPNSTLRYTTNGDNPTNSSPEYTEPISITNTRTVKAVSISNDPTIGTGKMDFNTYFIDESFTLNVFSVASDEVINLANGNGNLIPIGSIEYFENEEREAVSFGSLNRHGQDSWVLDHRSIDWVSRDEMGYTKAVQAELFSYSTRDEYQKFMFRNSGDDNYPAIDDGSHEGSCHLRDEYVHTLGMEGNMKLDQRAVERVILFLNGEYWGVYGMRERPVDHDYTDEYYDQGKYDLQYLSTWGNTEAQYGGADAFNDWGVLRDFVLENDMSIEANYDMVKDELNVLSLIDYMIVNLNCVASDWLNYNTGWWRGTNPDGDHKKWGYILWDLDATFDYYINYSGVPNTNPDAVPCDIDDISDFMDDFFWNEDVGKHEKIFLKLQEENEEFRQLYYSRQADMMNTVFTCDNMLETLDRLYSVIKPEMPKQVNRWGGTMEEWEANITTMREFIIDRCELFDDGMTECFDLTGPFDVTLLVEPANVGEIKINTIDIETFPWTGAYFGGMENKFRAKSIDDNYEFSHWVSSAGTTILPNDMDNKITMELTSQDTLTAVFAVIVDVNEIKNRIGFSSYPNPVSEDLNITYNLEEASDVRIVLTDAIGKQVAVIESGVQQSSGEQTRNINISDLDLAPGVYFLSLTINGAEVIEKLSVF